MMRNAVLISFLCLLSCGKPQQPTASAPAEEAAPVSATRWSARTELFVEYPPLVRGQDSRFAIHLTRLDNFHALRQGRVEVKLIRGTAEESFTVDAPSRPGIFGITVRPSSAGPVKLAIVLDGEGIHDRHDLGDVIVAADKSEVKHDAAEAEGISFLKEQQWTLDFATALAESRALRETLRVPAEVTARSGGEANVDAPLDGRLVLDRLPAIGSRVEANQVLASIVPPAANPADPTAIELARAEASTQLGFARKDRERAERLVAAGAAPSRRLDEARTLEATAEARLKAAEARLSLLESARSASGVEAARRFAIRAPISGIIAAVKSVPGANVKAGDILFQIVDTGTVYVSAIVPESEYPRMRGLSGAQLDVPGLDAPQPLTRLVTIGRVVDSPSRTFPVVYAYDNHAHHVAINQTVHVRILFQPVAKSAVVPESAIVDDNGSPIIFVQKAGETFERRAVRLGNRESGVVQVTGGITAGERIVVKGAHLIRLASMSSQAPAHGHVH